MDRGESKPGVSRSKPTSKLGSLIVRTSLFRSQRRAGRRLALASTCNLIRESEVPVRRRQIVVSGRSAGGYAAFPDLCRTQTGDLLRVFYLGTGMFRSRTQNGPKVVASWRCDSPTSHWTHFQANGCVLQEPVFQLSRQHRPKPQPKLPEVEAVDDAVAVEVEVAQIAGVAELRAERVLEEAEIEAVDGLIAVDVAEEAEAGPGRRRRCSCSPGVPLPSPSSAEPPIVIWLASASACSGHRPASRSRSPSR